MKRSQEPVFWALFGAGGMLSALLAPVLIFTTGIAVPLGWLPPDTLSAARLQAWLGQPLARLALLMLISLFMFHGCHRLLHSLHDLGLPRWRLAPWLFYGAALLASLAAAAVLLSIGG
jgi:fumarate reductase subunit D